MPIMTTPAFLYDFAPDDQINGDIHLRNENKTVAAVLQLPERYGCYIIYADKTINAVDFELVESYFNRRPTIVKSVVGSEFRIFEYETPGEWTSFRQNFYSRRIRKC